MVSQAEVNIQSMWQEYKTAPTLELRNRLIEYYFPLVKMNAERVWARLHDGVDLDDLISVGVFGLMDAIKSFDLSRGVKFKTFCVPRIRGAMLDELRSMDWVPRRVRSEQNKLMRARVALEAELGRSPEPEEMAHRLNITLDEFQRMHKNVATIGLVSLNTERVEAESYKDLREIDILEDKHSQDPSDRLQNRDLKEIVTSGLSQSERQIITLYYYEEMTMKEIGATLDLSESRVSQIHSNIVERISNRLKKRKFEFCSK